MEKRAYSERYKGLQPVKKGSIEAVEKGRKGGLAKRGSVSLVRAMKRWLRDNPGKAEELVTAWIDNSMSLQHGSRFAKIVRDSIDGTPVQRVRDLTPPPIQKIELVRPTDNDNSKPV